MIKNKRFLIVFVIVFMGLFATIASADGPPPIVPEPDEGSNAQAVPSLVDIGGSVVKPIEPTLLPEDAIVIQLTDDPEQNAANLRQALLDNGMDPNAYAEEIKNVASYDASQLDNALNYAGPGGLDQANAAGGTILGVFVPPCYAGHQAIIFGYVSPGLTHVSIAGSFPGAVAGQVVICNSWAPCGYQVTFGPYPSGKIFTWQAIGVPQVAYAICN